jgi:hypothetical protein
MNTKTHNIQTIDDDAELLQTISEFNVMSCCYDDPEWYVDSQQEKEIMV